jgi:hypothetical protein
MLVVATKWASGELLSEYFFRRKATKLRLAETPAKLALSARVRAPDPVAGHLDARHRRRDAALRNGLARASHDCRRDDVGPRHDRHRGVKAHADRRIRFSSRNPSRCKSCWRPLVVALKHGGSSRRRRCHCGAWACAVIAELKQRLERVANVRTPVLRLPSRVAVRSSSARAANHAPPRPGSCSKSASLLARGAARAAHAGTRSTLFVPESPNGPV